MLNKLLPILLVFAISLFPEIIFARDSYDAYSSRTGGGGGFSDILTWVILFFVFIFAIDKNPELLLYIIYFAVGLFALTALFKHLCWFSHCT